MKFEADYQNIHKAATQGKLNQVPENVFTETKLRLPDERLKTIFHLAAANGCLNQIPSKFLTKENLLLEDSFKDTALHYAAQNGFLKQVPKEILNEENLLKENMFGETPLDRAYKYIEFHPPLTSGKPIPASSRYPSLDIELILNSISKKTLIKLQNKYKQKLENNPTSKPIKRLLTKALLEKSKEHFKEESIEL